MNTALTIAIIGTAVVGAVGFLLLVLTLIPAIQQLRSALLDIEKTSAEVRDLAREWKRMGLLVEDRMEKVDAVLENTRRVTEGTAQTMHFINHNVLQRTAGIFAFLPAIKMGWNLVKKIKGGHR
ncbi:MAG TPA: DUF948 domain-containing protein [Candidatus Aminicenantes bacterium]|nr:DUF948 domain-containing protein [Candidatus Aminicenantes bacterium]